MFCWTLGQRKRKLMAAIRPQGYEYRNHQHHGHICRSRTLEVRDRTQLLLLLPLQMLEEVDETHALADLFEDVASWVRFHLWLLGQGYEPGPGQPLRGATGARPPRFTEREARILRGEGLKLPNRGLVDIDYADKLSPSDRALLGRALEHLYENRWRYDGFDLVEPGSDLARSIYRTFEARRRCYVVLPERGARDA